MTSSPHTIDVGVPAHGHPEAVAFADAYRPHLGRVIQQALDAAADRTHVATREDRPT